MFAGASHVFAFCRSFVLNQTSQAKVEAMQTSRKFFMSSLAAFFAATTLASAQTILFHEDFQSGGAPQTVANGGVWSFVSAGTGGAGTFGVVQDVDNLFGHGVDNLFLRVTNGIGFQLRGVLSQPQEVVTLSFEFADRRTTVSSTGAERLSVQMFGGSGIANANRAHILSLQNGGEIRTAVGRYQPNVIGRWDTIINNSDQTITYDIPGGGTATLGPAMATVWINGVNALTNAAGQWIFSRGAEGTGAVHTVTFQTFSTDRFSADLDNYTVFAGAFVLAQIPEPSAVALLGLGAPAIALFMRRRRGGIV
jgi:hypothetical protein